MIILADFGIACPENNKSELDKNITGFIIIITIIAIVITLTIRLFVSIVYYSYFYILKYILFFIN
jgi:hypothetical protein